MTRRRFSERDVLRTLIIQGTTIRCFRSKAVVTLENVCTVEREHLVTVALGGADAPENCRYSLAAEHKKQTYGSHATSYGSDRHGKDKADRIARGGKTVRRPMKPTGRKMESRGFDKRASRKFSGQVEKRT